MGFVQDLSLLVEIGGGILVLLFGRRLFWLLVGLTGFIAGMVFVRLFTEAPPKLGGIVIALALGIGAALLARFFMRFLFHLLGFFGGGILALFLTNIAEGGGNRLDWADVLAFIIGAFVGAFLLGRFADWGLIVLSALLGANALVTAVETRITTHPTIEVMLIVVLFFVGVSVQSGGANFFAGESPPKVGPLGLRRVARHKPPVVAGQG